MRSLLSLALALLCLVSLAQGLNVHHLTEFEKEAQQHQLNQAQAVSDPLPGENIAAVFRFFYPTLTFPDNVNEKCAVVADVMLLEANSASRKMDLVPRPFVPTGGPVSVIRSQLFGAVWRSLTNKGIYVAVRNVVAARFRTDVELCQGGEDPVLATYDKVRFKCFRADNQAFALVAGGCKRTTVLSCGQNTQCIPDTKSDKTLGIECTSTCMCKNGLINTCTCVHPIDTEHESVCSF